MWVAEAHNFAVEACGHVRICLVRKLHLLHRSVVFLCDELVAAHLVQGVSLLLNVVELVHLGVLSLSGLHAGAWAVSWAAELVLLIPVVDVVGLAALGFQALEERTFQLGVVRRLLKLVGEGLLQEWQQGESLWRFAEHPWRHLVLERLDPLELGLVELLVVCGLGLRFTVFCQEGKVTINEVEKQVRERDQIVSPAVGQKVEAVLAGEDEVSLEEPLFGGGDVLTGLGYVLHGESKINDLDLVEEVLMVSY